MKTRESGMPDEGTWQGFFNPDEVLHSLGLRPGMGRVVDFGSGYGLFSVPAAGMIDGEVIGLDIEPDLIELCREKVRRAGLCNARFECRDFVARGSGLEDDSTSYVMLFNILHAEDPGLLLREARRILAPDGVLGVLHWNYDPRTPRGPSMAIRPRPEQCRAWVREAGFTHLGALVDLPPWHYGFSARP